MYCQVTLSLTLTDDDVDDFADDDGAQAGSLPAFVKTAAESGNARVIKRWVNSTSRDVDSRSQENLTALHYAARGGHNECTRYC